MKTRRQTNTPETQTDTPKPAAPALETVEVAITRSIEQQFSLWILAG
jgi:hypothetical protein